MKICITLKNGWKDRNPDRLPFAELQLIGSRLLLIHAGLVIVKVDENALVLEEKVPEEIDEVKKSIGRLVKELGIRDGEAEVEIDGVKTELPPVSFDETAKRKNPFEPGVDVSAKGYNGEEVAAAADEGASAKESPAAEQSKNPFAPGTEADMKKDHSGNSEGEQGEASAEGKGEGDFFADGEFGAIIKSRLAELRKRKEEESVPEENFAQLQKRIVGMRKELSAKVKGQQHAIDAFVRTYFGAEVLTEKEHKGPLATFLFAGPPGCGKTFLAECAAPYCLGRKYLRVNMSEYGEFGSSINGNHLYKTEGAVTSFVYKNPKSVILFDEIEKASPSNIKLFLQILDAGFLTDNGLQKDVSFKDCILIFTTNVARNLYEESDGANLSCIAKNQIVAALESDRNPATERPYFPKELVSRWAKGTVILFNKLEPYAIKEIVYEALENKINTAQKNIGIKIDCDYDRVTSLIMYSVGGNADARTVVGAAARFAESELFDAINQLARRGLAVDNLKNIRIGVDYKKIPVENMFEQKEKINVLFAAGKKYSKSFRKLGETAGGMKVLMKSDLKSAKECFRNEIGAIVLDVFLGEKNAAARPGDLEDIESDGIALYDYVRQTYPEIPLYILNDCENGYEDNAFDTFLANGAKGLLKYDKDDQTANGESFRYVKDATVTGSNFYRLARSNKVLTYNCAQIFNGDGTEMTILARRLTLKRAVRAEDMTTVLADISRPKERFADIVGASEAKKTMQEFVKYLKNPKKYTATGAKAPKGILMYGPPGTGKTMLAKALAGETDVTFVQKNSTEFFKKYVGEGPEAMRALFRTARRYAPSIIFIDEVDAFAKMRTGGENSSSAEQLLNTFLSEVDGFKFDENRPVIVLVATNYEIKQEGNSKRVLDPAFVRRFDRKILIGLPDTDDRKALIRYFLHKHGVDAAPLAKGIETLAKRTVGQSPANIEMTVELAIRNANGGELTDAILVDSHDQDAHGESKRYSRESMLRSARHEAGHAIVSWACGNVPSYVTIVARGNYGGYVMPDVEESGTLTKKQILNRICMSLGGRAAELVYYGAEDGLSTGPSSDLETATQLACNIIGSWGMKDGSLAVADHFGEAVDKDMYEEANALLGEQLRRAVKLLEDNRDALEKLVKELLERNSLNQSDLEELLGAPGKKDCV